jgi:D-aminoacyl-tRNA deacylase
MRILVASRVDSASLNIRDRLLETGQWQPRGSFRDAPMLARGEARLIEVEGPAIRDEDLDGELAHLQPDAVWFLSRHRAESGHPSLTVHPIGNHHAAELGGLPATLAPAAARDMGALLRRLKARRGDLPHSVTYEATHHGPRMTVPSLFVEIGSNETWYEDQASGRVLAAAVHDVLDGEGTCNGPILVGVGGGHYVPQQTDRALAGEADFGHLVPAYAVTPDNAAEVVARAVEATPACEGIYMPKKGLKGPQRQAVQAWMEETGIEGVQP